jgi:hypothetical protein
MKHGNGLWAHFSKNTRTFFSISFLESGSLETPHVQWDEKPSLLSYYIDVPYNCFRIVILTYHTQVISIFSPNHLVALVTRASFKKNLNSGEIYKMFLILKLMLMLVCSQVFNFLFCSLNFGKIDSWSSQNVCSIFQTRIFFLSFFSFRNSFERKSMEFF